MAQTAFKDGELLLAYSIADGAWAEIQDLSAQGRLRMACCGGRAVARRSAGGLKHFAHHERDVCAAGLAAGEGGDHEWLKVQAIRTALSCGRRAVPEVAGAGWRADVLLTDPASGLRTAVEIQLAPQPGPVTRARIDRYRASGIGSIWFFGRRSDYDDVPAPLRRLPLFPLDGGSLAARCRSLHRTLRGVLRGTLAPDDGAGLDRVPYALVGYDLPCPGCGRSWFRSSFAVLYPNRVRGGDGPRAMELARFAAPQQVLDRHAALTGRAVGVMPGRARPGNPDPPGPVCPRCRADPGPEFLTPETAILCPDERFDGAFDYARLTGFAPGWRPPPLPPVAEPRLDPSGWQRLIAEGLAALDTRRRVRRASRRRVIAADDAWEQAQAARAAYVEAEYANIRNSLAPHLDPVAIERWLDRPLPGFAGRSPRTIIDEHAAAHNSALWIPASPLRIPLARALAAGDLAGIGLRPSVLAAACPNRPGHRPASRPAPSAAQTRRTVRRLAACAAAIETCLAHSDLPSSGLSRSESPHIESPRMEPAPPPAPVPAPGPRPGKDRKSGQQTQLDLPFPLPTASPHRPR